jgi:rubrerythrin
MATRLGTQKSIVEMLEQLTLLHYDAIEAYKTAIDRLNGAEAKIALTGFKADHERQVKELSDQLVALATTPPRGPDVKSILTSGRVLIGSLMGDRAVLMAMKTNEDDTNRAYERASSRDDLPESLRELMKKNLEDERRHRVWLEAHLRPRAPFEARR